jgi:hypothetical protein
MNNLRSKHRDPWSHAPVKGEVKYSKPVKVVYEGNDPIMKNTIEAVNKANEIAWNEMTKLKDPKDMHRKYYPVKCA